MAVPLAARWLLTAVLVMAGPGAALPRRGRAATARPVDRVAAVLCPVMCAALIAMTWRSEPAAAKWVQVAAFGCAALWFALASLPGPGPVRRSGLTSLHPCPALACPPRFWPSAS